MAERLGANEETTGPIPVFRSHVSLLRDRLMERRLLHTLESGGSSPPLATSCRVGGVSMHTASRALALISVCVRLSQTVQKLSFFEEGNHAGYFH